MNTTLLQENYHFCATSGLYRDRTIHHDCAVADMGVYAGHVDPVVEQLCFGCITVHVDDMKGFQQWQFINPRWIKKGWELDFLCGSHRHQIKVGQPFIFDNHIPHCVMPKKCNKTITQLMELSSKSGYLDEAIYAKEIGMTRKQTSKLLVKSLGMFAKNKAEVEWLVDNTNTVLVGDYRGLKDE